MSPQNLVNKISLRLFPKCHLLSQQSSSHTYGTQRRHVRHRSHDRTRLPHHLLVPTYVSPVDAIRAVRGARRCILTEEDKKASVINGLPLCHGHSDVTETTWVEPGSSACGQEKTKRIRRPGWSHPGWRNKAEASSHYNAIPELISRIMSSLCDSCWEFKHVEVWDLLNGNWSRGIAAVRWKTNQELVRKVCLIQSESSSIHPEMSLSHSKIWSIQKCTWKMCLIQSITRLIHPAISLIHPDICLKNMSNTSKIVWSTQNWTENLD